MLAVEAILRFKLVSLGGLLVKSISNQQPDTAWNCMTELSQDWFASVVSLENGRYCNSFSPYKVHEKLHSTKDHKFSRNRLHKQVTQRQLWVIQLQPPSSQDDFMRMFSLGS